MAIDAAPPRGEHNHTAARPGMNGLVAVEKPHRRHGPAKDRRPPDLMQLHFGGKTKEIRLGSREYARMLTGARPSVATALCRARSAMPHWGYGQRGQRRVADVKLFLSCVSNEFGACREVLDHELTSRTSTSLSRRISARSAWTR